MGGVEDDGAGSVTGEARRGQRPRRAGADDRHPHGRSLARGRARRRQDFLRRRRRRAHLAHHDARGEVGQGGRVRKGGPRTAGEAALPDAAALANLAAGVVVGKVGTATATPEEVLGRRRAALDSFQ